MTSVQVETVDAVRRRLVVEIPAEEVTREIDEAFTALRRTVNVPGFRRGRAPRTVLERVAGERLRAEVLERLVQSSFVDALRQERIDAVGYPEITTESAAQAGQPLRYSATVEVVPEIEVAGYEGIEVERPLRQVEDSDVEQYLEQMRQSAARVEPIADRSVAVEGDVATIDYEARVADRLIGKGDDRLVRVGGDDAHELGAHLAGVAVGASTEFTIVYPDDFGRPELDGKTVAFAVDLKAIGTRQVPPLDDDFAKAYGGFEDLGQLRARVRQEMEAQAARDADAAARTSIVDALLGANPFDVPQTMVDRRADALVSELFASVGQRRPPASRELEMREKLRQDMAPRARDQVRANLVLEAIARAEGIEVGDDELEAEIDQHAQHAGASGDHLRALYAEPSARMGLRLQLLRDRALDRVVKKANVRTVQATAEEKSIVAGTPGNG